MFFNNQWSYQRLDIFLYDFWLTSINRVVLHIDFSAIEAGELSIKVMDMSARIVKQSQATAEVGMNNMTLNLGDLSNGIYTIQIIQNNKLSSVHRVIKN